MVASDGGPIYLATEASEILTPSLSSSLWIRGAPQSGFSRLIVRITSVICAPDFHTSDYRDKQTTPAQKATTYKLYNIPRPTENTGANQECELDHLVSLEVGGADDLSNSWLECRPGYAGWAGAGFRDKDKFENY